LAKPTLAQQLLKLKNTVNETTNNKPSEFSRKSESLKDNNISNNYKNNEFLKNKNIKNTDSLKSKKIKSTKTLENNISFKKINSNLDRFERLCYINISNDPDEMNTAKSENNSKRLSSRKIQMIEFQEANKYIMNDSTLNQKLRDHCK